MSTSDRSWPPWNRHVVRRTMLWATLPLILSAPSDSLTARAYEYAVPEKIEEDGWETSPLSDENFDAAPINEMLNRIERGVYPNVRSVLIARNGKLVVEEHFPRPANARERAFRRVAPQEITSATKSITSILIGIAIDRGMIKGVDEPIAALLPEHANALSADFRDKLLLKHLLSMCAGLAWDEWTHPYSDPRNDHIQMLLSPSPIRYALSRPALAMPGKRFAYSSGISIALGEIIRHTSGMTVVEFAERFLFEPLGITDFYWAKYPGELVQTGGGLHLRSRDMSKIGCLFLNGGQWQGKQIVSEAWVRDSTRNQVPAGEIPAAARANGYGYQWWISSIKSGNAMVPTYSARGRGGQFILVIPSAELVVVFTSAPENSLTFQPLDIIERYIIPACKAAGAGVVESDRKLQGESEHTDTPTR